MRGRTTRGLTLLELAVAILILSIGAVAALRATGQARVTLGGDMPRQLVQSAALNRLAEVRLLGPSGASGLPNTVQQGPYQITLSQENNATEAGFVEVTVQGRTQSGEGALFVTYVTPGLGLGAGEP